MTEQQGLVYIGSDRSGTLKIGITKDHKKRFRQFKTANPRFKYLAVFTSENPAVTELAIHTKFEHKRFEGEWFSLSPEDVMWILDEYVNHNFTLDDLQSVWNEVAG